MASKINYGIQDGYIAIITEDAQGNITYGTPIRVPGIVSLNVDPQSTDATPFYADNIEYYTVPAQNQGYQGELVLAMTPDSFLTGVLGMEQDSDGVVYESAGGTIHRFALLFQAQGDDKNRRFCFYDCTATRPSRNHETKEETAEPGTDTLPITMKPRSSDGLVKSQIEQTTENTSVYNAWFSSVHEKPTSL